MRVAHEDVAHAKEHTRGKRGHIADIEEDRATLEPQIDPETRIAPHAIDELCLKNRLHGL